MKLNNGLVLLMSAALVGCSVPPAEVTPGSPTLTFGDQDDVSVMQFENTSKQDVLLSRVMDDPGASAGWSTIIHPGNVSALVVNHKHLTFGCTLLENRISTPTDCHEVLKAQVQEHEFDTPPAGNYWLFENKSPQEASEILVPSTSKVTDEEEGTFSSEW